MEYIGEDNLSSYEHDMNVYMSLDFMAIRKIPLKERSYFMDDASAQRSEADGSVQPEDPKVSTLLHQIRRKLLTDRALHDQVSGYTS
jgi:ATP-dependent RNA helicase DDX55/SPB4